MPLPAPTSPRLPQRLLVAAAPAPASTAFLERLAAVLDLPLVLGADLAGSGDAERLAAFEGWVATTDDPAARDALLARADLLVLAQLEATGTLRGLVRRTVRRIRADAAPATDPGWADGVAVLHPDLPVVRLAGPDQAEAWVASWQGPLSG